VKTLLLTAVVSVFAFACSSSSEEDDEDDEGDARLRAFIASQCDALMPCCAEASLPTDGAACRTLFGETFATGDYAFDDAAAAECSAWLDGLSGTEACGDTIYAPEACGDVFVPQGDSQPGERCDTPGDCAASSEGGVLCFGGSGAQKTCQLVVEGTEGSAPCAWSVRGSTSTTSSNFDEPRVYSCDVADGLYCDETTCVPVIAAGNPCSESKECALGTYCASDGLCTSQVPGGSSCESSDACLEGSCENFVCVAGDIGLRFLCGASEP